MNTDIVIRITVALHKVVATLPDEEELRVPLRDAANTILSNLILMMSPLCARTDRQRILQGTRESIRQLQGYLKEVRSRVGVEEKNFLLMEDQYSKIDMLLEGMEEDSSFREEQAQEVADSQRFSVAHQTPRKEQGLSRRQEKIIALLGHKQKVQVWELQKMMPEVTKRTLRRDLDSLLEQNLVERLGEWNSIAYKLKI